MKIGHRKNDNNPSGEENVERGTKFADLTKGTGIDVDP